jgi:hypothetical protein
MSTTTNVQSFLPYVFRPAYTYTSNGFAATFNIRNIDNITAGSLSVSQMKVGDNNNNVYVGNSSGNLVSQLSTCNAYFTAMVGISAGGGQSNASNVECLGYSTGQTIRNVTNSSFIGAFAGSNASNVTGSLFIGTNSGQEVSNALSSIAIGQNTLSNVKSASNVIAIGTNTAVGASNANGGSNIYIGNSNTIGLTGAGNIIIGHCLAPPQYSVGGVLSSVPANMSNKLFIGSGSNVLIAGDFASGCVSIGSTNTTPNSLNGPYYTPILPTGAQIQLDVAKYVRVGQGLAIGFDPGLYQLDVNGPFHLVDGGGGEYWMSNSQLTVTGSIYASGDITALSDQRYKTNVSTVSNALSMVESLRGVYFTPTSDPTTRKIGLIAQEVEKVLPEVVVTDTGEDKKKSISYGNVVGLLIEAVKELSEQVKDLNLKLLRHFPDGH